MMFCSMSERFYSAFSIQNRPKKSCLAKDMQITSKYKCVHHRVYGNIRRSTSDCIPRQPVHASVQKRKNGR